MAFNPYYVYTPQYGKTPYYMQQPNVTPQYQPQATDYMNQMQNAYQKPLGLQGKTVDNIEVVKATDIPLDGSISYFPLVDGSSIVTKQLLYMIHLIVEIEECGMHGKLISSVFQELIYGKLDKRSRLDCKSRRELGSTATCLQY